MRVVPLVKFVFNIRWNFRQYRQQILPRTPAIYCRPLNIKSVFSSCVYGTKDKTAPGKARNGQLREDI